MKNAILIEGLKEFGLNPNNWKILYPVQQKNIWLVMHKKYPNCYLKGMTYMSGRWRTLEWLS